MRLPTLSLAVAVSTCVSQELPETLCFGWAAL